jgi:type IV pilus assembly protein PilE
MEQSSGKYAMKMIDPLFTMRTTRSAGFTLMELMMVLAVVAILAAIAYPSYMDQVMKSKRAVAKNALLDLANRQEQYFFDNRTYANTLNKLTGFTSYSPPILFDDQGSPTTTAADAIYALNVTAYNNANCDSVNSNPVCFKIQAVPQNGQSKDACGSFTIDSSNKKEVTGTGSGCW